MVFKIAKVIFEQNEFMGDAFAILNTKLDSELINKVDNLYQSFIKWIKIKNAI
jgi:hypothetical protein